MAKPWCKRHTSAARAGQQAWSTPSGVHSSRAACLLCCRQDRAAPLPARTRTTYSDAIVLLCLDSRRDVVPGDATDRTQNSIVFIARNFQGGWAVRKVILIAGLVASAGNIASAGMPYFNNTAQAGPAAAEQESTGWKFPRLWGKKDTAQDPQFFYQAPAEPPTTTERLTSAVTDNAAVKTARSWMTPSAKASERSPSDPISLNQPTGKPTSALTGIDGAGARETRGCGRCAADVPASSSGWAKECGDATRVGPL